MKSTPTSLVIADEVEYFEGAIALPGSSIETSCYRASGSVLLSVSVLPSVPRGNSGIRLTPKMARELAAHLIKAAKKAQVDKKAEASK